MDTSAPSRVFSRPAATTDQAVPAANLRTEEAAVESGTAGDTEDRKTGRDGSCCVSTVSPFFVLCRCFTVSPPCFLLLASFCLHPPSIVGPRAVVPEVAARKGDRPRRRIHTMDLSGRRSFGPVADKRRAMKLRERANRCGGPQRTTTPYYGLGFPTDCDGAPSPRQSILWTAPRRQAKKSPL